MAEQANRIVTYLDEWGFVHPIAIEAEWREVKPGVFKKVMVYRHPTEEEYEEWQNRQTE